MKEAFEFKIVKLTMMGCGEAKRCQMGKSEFSLLKPGGFFTFHKVNIQNFYMALDLC